MPHSCLLKAKKEKADEFYTTYEDIRAELRHYEDKFRGKTVLCNCDNPYESHFCGYFFREFNYLGLDRLICTSFSSDGGHVMDVRESPAGLGGALSDAGLKTILKSGRLSVKKLSGDGDFRSEECIGYLRQADIIVTNPPFSLFREYVAQLMAYKKRFLILGNTNAITYRGIFPLIKTGELWLGASIHSGDRMFYVPKDYPIRALSCGTDGARRYVRVNNVRWFTNLDYVKRYEKLVLHKRYYGNEAAYLKYDNYNAININKTSEIPGDYFGNMGVPITFIDKHCPEQFTIVGATESEGKGFSSGLWIPGSRMTQPVVQGKRLYKRLFVRRTAAT